MANDESSARVREFIEARLTDDIRKSHQIVLPGPPSFETDILTFESVTGGDMPTYCCLIARAADRAAIVWRLEVRAHASSLPDPPGYRSGCTTAIAEVPVPQLHSLLRDLLLLKGAGLVRSHDGAKLPGRPSTGARYGRVRVEIGRTWEFEDEISPFEFVRLLADEGIGATALARLLLEYVREATDAWAFRPVTPAEEGALCAELLRTIPAAAGFRQRFRVLALGALGYEPAADLLAQLATSKCSEAALAIRQIDLRRRYFTGVKPPPELRDAVLSGDPWLANWAKSLVLSRSTEDYKRLLRSAFVGATQAGRLFALEELAALDPADTSLAADAITDSAPQVRIEGARLLRRPDILFDAIASKAIVGEEGVLSRQAAIGCVSWELTPIGDTRASGDLLRAVLLDATDDVRVRQAAAEATGHLMDTRAIPDLMRVVQSSVPRQPVYLGEHREIDVAEYLSLDDVRIGAVRALGMLRAKEAVGFLVEYLARPPDEHEESLRDEMAFALARIADKRAEPVLRRLRREAAPEDAARGDWLVRFFNAVRERDLATILEYDNSSPRSHAALLLDLFSLDELRSHLAVCPAGREREFLESVLAFAGAR